MRTMKMKNTISISRLLPVAMIALALLFATTAHGATPGITGPTFNLTAQTAFLNQPDGAAVYPGGYGCNVAPAGFAPAAIPASVAKCPTMQVPGPTLVQTVGETATVTLLHRLHTPA